MATEVITRTLCDVHLAEHDEQLDGAAYTITIDGESWTLDVCPVDAKVIAEFREWVGKYGRTPDKPRRRSAGRPPIGPTNGDRGFPCPAKDCSYVGHSEAVLRQHTRAAHNATVHDLAGTTTDYRCPGCGSYFDGNQGLTMHVKRTHGGWEAAKALGESEPASSPAPARRKARKSA